MVNKTKPMADNNSTQPLELSLSKLEITQGTKETNEVKTKPMGDNDSTEIVEVLRLQLEVARATKGIEKEKTKQIKEQEQTKRKQFEEEEETKRKHFELSIILEKKAGWRNIASISIEKLGSAFKIATC